jgi:hypothetical protein
MVNPSRFKKEEASTPKMDRLLASFHHIFLEMFGSSIELEDIGVVVVSASSLLPDNLEDESWVEFLVFRLRSVAWGTILVLGWLGRAEKCGGIRFVVKPVKQ